MTHKSRIWKRKKEVAPVYEWGYGKLGKLYIVRRLR